MKVVQESGAAWQMYRGNCLLHMHRLEAVDHIITDPPYSEHVHQKSRRGANLPDTAEFECRFNRAHEFGFDAITPRQMRRAGTEFARLAKRWVIVFSNVEISHDWRQALKPLEYVRTLVWVKLRATPQFTGDRPAAGFEAMTLAHPKGRKRWNGGGKQGVYIHPVVQNDTADRHARMHTAQKPLELMLDLVRDFTDVGDTVLDPFAGSATTGVACIRLGRRFIGIERDKEYFRTACDRLIAEERESTVHALRSGQVGLFEAVR